MHYFALSFLIYIRFLSVHSAEEPGSLWSFNDENSGFDKLTLPSLNDQDGPLLFSDDSTGDATWNINEVSASEASLPLEDTQTSDLILSLDSSSRSGEFASILEENTLDGSLPVDDLLESEGGCPESSDISVAMPRALSTGRNPGTCAAPEERKPQLNIPGNLKLEDILRLPGFVPAFRGMSDSCIIYSNGILPYGVCSSADPDDTYFSRETFFGWITWTLGNCNFGKWLLRLFFESVSLPWRLGCRGISFMAELHR